MQIQIKKNIPSKARGEFNGGTVFINNQSYSHSDGPFELDDKKAHELIKLGLADAVINMPQSTAQRAVAPKLEAQRR